MKRSGKKPRILVLYSGVVPSVEISVLLPLQFLQRKGAVDLRTGTVADFDFSEALPWCDLVVFSRCCLIHELPVLCKVMELGIPYIYDLDDNFFRLAADKEPSQPWLQKKGVIETLIAFLSGAAVVKTGSEQLMNDIKKYNPHVVIHEYVVDFSLISEKSEPKECMIGYAGSLAHKKDLTLLLEVLNQIAGAYPRVRFAFYGAQPDIDGNFTPELLAKSEFIPYQKNYAAFLRDVSSRGWSIALAPLEDTIANRSKTDNKFREYAACKIAGVYSKMPVYERRIQDGQTGMLAEYTTERWYEKIAYLLDHPQEREMMAERAYEKVKAENAMEHVAEQWLEELILPHLKQLSGKEKRRERLSSLWFHLSVYRRVLEILPLQAVPHLIMYWLRARLAAFGVKW